MTVGEDLKEQGWIGIYNIAGRGSERPPAMLGT